MLLAFNANCSFVFPLKAYKFFALAIIFIETVWKIVDCDDVDTLELQRRLELFNDMIDSGLNVTYDKNSKRQYYLTQCE